MLNQFTAIDTDSFLFCDEDASDWNSNTDASVSALHSLSSSSTLFTLGFQNSDEELTNVARLLDTESDHVPDASYVKKYQDRSVVISGREISVNWIMKVHGYYKFKPVTALLAVNYFDRFLSAHQLPQEEKGWSFQLLSVACLTLAAKMEEMDVPSLLDFQLFEPKFLFDAKTVQKMELLVMENLKWRLHAITPLHFIEYFVANLSSSCDSSSSHSKESFCDKIVSGSSSHVLSTVYMIEFVGLLPSAIAAAAVILAASENVQVPESFYNGLNKDMVTSCHQAMKKCLSATSQLSHLKRQLSCATPPFSPAGILDVVNLSSLSTRNSEASHAHAPEHAFKRLKPSIPDLKTISRV